MHKKSLIVSIIVIVIFVGVAWIFAFSKKENSDEKIYRNEKFGFEVSYPSIYYVSKDGPDQAELLFEETGKKEGADVPMLEIVAFKTTDGNQRTILSIEVPNKKFLTIKGDYGWDRTCALDPGFKTETEEKILIAGYKTLHRTSINTANREYKDEQESYCVNFPPQPIILTPWTEEAKNIIQSLKFTTP